jgi:hypothetical protein
MEIHPKIRKVGQNGTSHKSPVKLSSAGSRGKTVEDNALNAGMLGTRSLTGLSFHGNGHFATDRFVHYAPLVG